MHIKNFVLNFNLEINLMLYKNILLYYQQPIFLVFSLLLKIRKFFNV